ncbi:MAG: hypothetical protein GZ093_15570 [Rhodoferax sp.]|jgi:hypothetical protein|uniref:hypothetical protein n=1 Tax=Rhodoferax sp. TaxID=50421 RepID=UPI0013FEC69D|nr:hypothetical protein [Rhodoferax sp.]NDP40142.1 hypothetical protein [Rhodoferax sp.]
MGDLIFWDALALDCHAMYRAIDLPFWRKRLQNNVRQRTQVIGQFSIQTLADVVETAPGYAASRETGVAVTNWDKERPQARRLVELLDAPGWAVIFSKWTWKTNCAQ